MKHYGVGWYRVVVSEWGSGVWVRGIVGCKESGGWWGVVVRVGGWGG